MTASPFRPIYYLGCKNEFTAPIRAAIDSVDPSGGRLGDLFSGTGSVAASLAQNREVTTVDVQEYSRVLCSAVLNPPGLTLKKIAHIVAEIKAQSAKSISQWCVQPLIDHEKRCAALATKGMVEPLISLLESQPIGAMDVINGVDSALQEAMNVAILRLKGEDLWSSPETTVSRLFGGIYFSFEQAVALDHILTYANANLNPSKDTLVAAALGVASSLVNTVGKQFAQPLRPRNKNGGVKTTLEAVVRRDRSMDAIATYEAWLGRYAQLPLATGTPKALRQDYAEAIEKNASTLSVLYADPPYTRDHYSRFYHVLETMCLRDNPAYSKVTKQSKAVVSRGLYREDRHQSDFCIRSRAPNAFDKLFESARQHDLPLVLSYSPHEAGDGTHPRVVSMDQIVEIANCHYQRVEVSAIHGSTHNILNKSSLKLQAREHAEILLKCYR